MENKKGKAIKTLMIGVIIITAGLLLVPLVLSFFSFPMPGDDYANARTIGEAIKSGGGITGAIGAAFAHAADIYMRFQGNFSGVLVMGLNPLLISVSAYQWTLFGINLLFMVSVVVFFVRLISKRWKIDGIIAVLIAVLLIFIAYNRLMSYIEFGCNFISASYYTLPFSLALFYVVLLLKINKGEKRHTAAFIALLALSAFLGLSNYPLAVMLFAGLGIALLIAVITKHHLWKRLLVLLLVFSVFFAVSLFAPGNSARASEQWMSSFGLFGAMLASFVMGTKLALIALVSTPLLGVMVLLTPMIIKQARERAGRFNHPLLFSAAAYVVFIAQYFPVLYTSGYNYLGRVENIKWICALILIVVCYINFVGFMAQKKPKWQPKHLPVATAAVGSVLVLFCLWAYYIAPAKIDDALYVHRMHYETAFRQAVSGELKTFRAEQMARFEVMEDDSIREVAFEPLTYNGVISGVETLYEEKDENRNKVFARFYDKTYVYILPQKSDK